MTDDTAKKDYKTEIKELLDNYEDGWDIFKKADDWTYPATLKPESRGKDLPSSWIELADKVISLVAHGKYELDTYPNTIAIIDSEQMLNAYTSIGMPVSYNHWSFGKARAQQEKAYEQGQMGLAYEIVINTNPAIAYCMAQNTKTMQMLVIAHASYGHNSFFKNNHLFKQFTDAGNIIDDLTRLKDKVAKCEEMYGYKEVEQLLDACHALESHGVNRFTKPAKRTPAEEAERRRKIEDLRNQHYDDVMERTVGSTTAAFQKAANDNSVTIPNDMEENLLKYIASDAPHLKPWQREIIKEVSDKAQYFYPQRQTQVMNEGWATFWHHTIMTDLHEMDLINDGMMLEFIASHSGVVGQQDFDSKYYNGGFNPYALGLTIYQDIQRMCEKPTEEDRKWFPDIAGKPWLPTLKEAMENHKDESFILQYLSPKVIRDMHLFAVLDDDRNNNLYISAIHDDEGYKDIRKTLAAQYNLGDREPRIEVADYNYRGDRSLILQHTMHNRKPIDERDTKEVLKHMYQLWGHPVFLHSVDEDGKVVKTLGVPQSANPPVFKPAANPFAAKPI